MFFGGECLDVNREQPLWSHAMGDTAGWSPVKVFHPDLVVSADLAEPNRLIAELKPVSIEPVGTGTYRVDFGANFAGWVEARLQGEPGQRVELLFSERAGTNMTQQMHSALVLGPDGRGQFRNRFNYGVGRWLTIRGVTAPPEASAIRGWMVRSDYEPAARFQCSNPLFNRIHATALWTFENLSVGGYLVDCPHRERMGYGGDAHATVDTALDNYLFGAVYTKWSQDWRDVQAADGQLPYTAPTYWGGGGPAWCGWVVTLPWEVYLHYGDRRILEDNFPTMQRWLAFMETRSRDNLLRRWGGEWDFLGDWLWPGAKGVNGDTQETLFFNNCYWIYALDRASRIASVLGQGDAARGYRRRVAEVRQAVHAAFYNPVGETYVNSDMAYLAMALYVDVPPAEVRPAIWRRLEYEIRTRRQGHIHAGITGGAFLFKALIEANRNDLLLEMVGQKTYPSWGDQLQRGATTFWESWEDNPELSYLHSSFLYVGSWFNQALAGIRPDPEHPGFRRFVLRPFVPPDGSVTWVRASHNALPGPIESSWRVEDAQLHYDVTVPPNTSAVCFVPARQGSNVLESGRPVREVRGVTWQRDEPESLVLLLEPGQYHFTSRWGSLR
jgi:alpha-L-rhamnosidase